MAEVKIKKANGTKKCAIKRKLKFEIQKNCLEVTQTKNKINYLEKNKIDADSVKKNHKKCIEISKLLLKTRQRFRSEKHNVFTEQINNITLSLNDDKIGQKHMHMEQAMIQ